ncbi:MAG: hypothetical protein LBV23_02660 [Deltaproteobacteria bacterium]|jgi:hypothetical protein|nr:hypothetical protein [Deltaproteobacteria bacterium]
MSTKTESPHNTIRTEILKRLNEKDYKLEFTNSDIAEPITSFEQKIELIPHILGVEVQPIVPGQPEISVDVHRPKLKIDKKGYVCYWFNEIISEKTSQWEKVLESLIDSAHKSFMIHLNAFILNEMVINVSYRNIGTGAGYYGNYNLGSVDTPLHITPENVLEKIYELGEVLREQNHWVSGEMFLVVPNVVWRLISLSPEGNAALEIDRANMIIDGSCPKRILGFNVYEANTVSLKYIDSHPCDYMIAGHRHAYAQAASHLPPRISVPEDNIGTKIKIPFSWGGAMLYPDWIAVAFAWFDPQITY